MARQFPVVVLGEASSVLGVMTPTATVNMYVPGSFGPKTPFSGYERLRWTCRPTGYRTRTDTMEPFKCRTFNRHGIIRDFVEARKIDNLGSGALRVLSAFCQGEHVPVRGRRDDSEV